LKTANERFALPYHGHGATLRRGAGAVATAAAAAAANDIVLH